MRIQEQYIVPGLGVVILMSVLGFVASGASILFLLAMVVLGLAAVGTYLLPHGAQVEVRVAIAVLGLLFLLLYFSHLAFWLVLLAFGAIGAFQFRHSGTLQMPPQHTVAWAKGLLGRPAAVEAAAAATTPDAEPDSGSSGDAAPAATAAPASRTEPLPGLSMLQGKLRVNVGGIGASLIGAFIVLLVFTMPWIGISLSASFAGETISETESFTLVESARELRSEEGDWIPALLAVVMGALAIASAASVVFPRVVGVILSIAGMAATMVATVYLWNTFFNLSEPLREPGVTVLVLPIAPFFVGPSFFAMLVLQLIPPLNRTKPKAAPPPAEG